MGLSARTLRADLLWISASRETSTSGAAASLAGSSGSGSSAAFSLFGFGLDWSSLPFVCENVRMTGLFFRDPSSAFDDRVRAESVRKWPSWGVLTTQRHSAERCRSALEKLVELHVEMLPEIDTSVLDAVLEHLSKLVLHRLQKILGVRDLQRFEIYTLQLFPSSPFRA
jgi:hypothetical protein